MTISMIGFGGLAYTSLCFWGITYFLYVLVFCLFCRYIPTCRQH